MVGLISRKNGEKLLDFEPVSHVFLQILSHVGISGFFSASPSKSKGAPWDGPRSKGNPVRTAL